MKNWKRKTVCVWSNKYMFVNSTRKYAQTIISSFNKTKTKWVISMYLLCPQNLWVQSYLFMDKTCVTEILIHSWHKF